MSWLILERGGFPVAEWRSERTRCRALSRFLSWALAIVILGLGLCLGAPGPAAAAQPVWLPGDLTEAVLDPYGLSLDVLRQVSDGYPDGSWHPYDPVTRAQFAKFVVLACGLTPIHPGTTTFPDVPRSAEHYPFVETAVASGMVHGYDDGLFHPDDPVTREQAAAMVVRYLVVKHGRNFDQIMGETEIAYHLGLYADGDEVSDPLQAEVALASARSVLVGVVEEGKYHLHPHESVTRIQAVALSLRHEKPGAFRNASGLEPSQILAELASEVVKKAACGIVQGLGSRAGQSLWDALVGKRSFSDIQDQLTRANESIADVQKSLADIQKELAGLLAQYQAVSAKIEAMIAGFIAQPALDAIRAAYDDPGIINNYYYFTHMKAVPPDPDGAAADLEAFLRARVSATDMPKYLNDIHTAVLPAGAKVGVLDEWVVAVCTGALSEQELWDAYMSLEYYFCLLVSYQLKCGHLIMEADNHLDRTGTQATLFLTDNWFPKLQAECDNFLGNVIRFCLMNGAYESTADMLGDQTLHDILARATFVYSQLLQQIGDQKNLDPQVSYGLKVLVVHPEHAREIANKGLVARDAELGLQEVSAATDYTVAPVSGPSVLAWNDTDASNPRLFVDSRYLVRLLTFPVVPPAPGSSLWVLDELPLAARSTRYGRTGVAWYDDSYRRTTDGNGVSYGLFVLDYSSNRSSMAGAGDWSTPQSLGGGGPVWTRHDQSLSDDLWVDGSNPSTGLFQFDWVDARNDDYIFSFGWDVSYRLPVFTYVGPSVALARIANMGGVDAYQVVHSDRKGTETEAHQRFLSILAEGEQWWNSPTQSVAVEAGGMWNCLEMKAGRLPALTATLRPGTRYAVGVQAQGAYADLRNYWIGEHVSWDGEVKYQWKGTTAQYAGVPK